MRFCIGDKLNWLYIDINSYFATIEQQLNHNLRHKPVAVVPLLSDSTCAIAVSYEAKLKGIKTGTKIYQAKKLCPELICIPAKHDRYIRYHNKIFQEIDKYLKVDHIFSIDEGACRLTGKYCMLEEAISIGHVIKEGLKKNVGDYITCSIGIAPNRYLAKIASNMQKPDGLISITPEELPEKLYALKLRDFPGIGAKTEERLLQRGVLSIQQLCAYDAKKLKSVWGNIWGEKAWYLLRGADLPLEEVKNSTIGHSKILAPELRNVDSARNILFSLILKAASRLRSRQLYTSSMLLNIDNASMKVIKDRIKIELSDDNNTILKAAIKSYDKLVKTYAIKTIKKVGISFHGLQPEPTQLSFADLTSKHKHQRLSMVIDNINKKLGDNMVTVGGLTKKHIGESVVAFNHIPELK